jgi:AAA domain/Primase C terminal 2 (PriCT-2)
MSAAKLAEFFAGFPSGHGTHGEPVQRESDGKWEIKTSARWRREPVTLDLWQQHVAGTRPLGVGPTREDGTCSWGSIDVDDYAMSAVDLIRAIERHELPLVSCRSKSGGLHLFLFVQSPVPAAEMRAALAHQASRLGLNGAEVFPKQTALAPGGCPAWLVMPYFGSTYGGKIHPQECLRPTGGALTMDEFVRQIDASQCSPEKFLALLDGSQIIARPSRAASPTDEPAIFDEAFDALCTIPASLSYNEWRNVTYAFAAATRGDARAFPAWDAWCRTCPEKYEGVKQREYWRDFSKPGLITKATLFRTAMDDYGWNPREYWDSFDEEFIEWQRGQPYGSRKELEAMILEAAERGGRDTGNAMVDKAAALAWVEEKVAPKPNGEMKFETADLRQHEDGPGPAPKNEKFFKDDELRQRTREAPRAVLFKSAADLQHMRFADLKYIVPGLIVEGLTLFAGRPKIGKSWLVDDICIAVTTGGTCLGVKCEKGDVLLLALEDNDRRLQRRLTKLLGANKTGWPANLRYATQFPNTGAQEFWLDAELKNNPGIRLVVIDTWKRYRTAKNAKQADYDQDYDALVKVQELASRHGVSIIVVHHTRKAKGDEVIDEISGTNGLAGAADAWMVIRGTPAGKVLSGSGRDIEEFEKAVSFDKETCRWKMLGDPEEVRMGDTKRKILDVLRAARCPMGPREIALATGIDENTVKQSLIGLVMNDKVSKVRRGKYMVNNHDTSQEYADSLI